MSTEQEIERAGFYRLLETLYGSVNTNDSLGRMRLKAWEAFVNMGLPSKSDDVYRYIRLKKLFARHYERSYPTPVTPDMIAPYILPECHGAVLVSVNGHFTPTLSQTEKISGQVTVTSIAEAMRTYSGLLTSQWNRVLKEDKDPFAILNLAGHQDGLFLYISPNTVIETPIQLLNIVHTQDAPMWMMPRIHCFVGGHSQVVLASTHGVISGENYGINGVIDLALEEGSRVQMVQSACDLTEQLWFFDAMRATLKRNSHLKVVATTTGSETIRHDYRVSLIGENAEVMLSGIWKLQGKKEAHTHVIVDHQVPYCRSMQLFKGVLDDTSRSSFEGKILVRQAAQKTEAFQLNRNLLLSDYAHADSKPNLEIFADDVKASHGTTVGPLDKEEIFYMKTRGLSTSVATHLLVKSFCDEVINMIPVPSLQK